MTMPSAATAFFEEGLRGPLGVDALRLSSPGRSLGWLLSRIGLFHGAHRAADDVDAVIALLGHRLPSGRTALGEMVESRNRENQTSRRRI